MDKTSALSAHKERLDLRWRGPNWPSTRAGKATLIALLLMFTTILGCERATTLTIEGVSPPKFVMSGNGILRAIRLVGPTKQREAQGEEASVYWLIESKESRYVDSVGTVTYGQVPEGFVQKYPESGDPPPLVEGARYNVRIMTDNAAWAYQVFQIKDGKISVIYSQ